MKIITTTTTTWSGLVLEDVRVRQYSTEMFLIRLNFLNFDQTSGILEEGHISIGVLF